MPTFDSIERSIQDSAPIELFTFTTPALVTRLTTHDHDVTVGGFTYAATPGARSSFAVPDVSTDQYDVTIELPSRHPIVQDFANGQPRRRLEVLIDRYQPASGIAIPRWDGFVSELQFKRDRDEHWGVFTVPCTTSDALRVECPSVKAQRLCQHVLYDARCTIQPIDNDIATTIALLGISGDGRTFSLTSALPAPLNGTPWSRHGRLLHVPSGEARSIVDQIGTTQVVIQVEFPLGLVSELDAVIIYAGCDKRATTCSAKFLNIANFGGHNFLPQSNVYYEGLNVARYR